MGIQGLLISVSFNFWKGNRTVSKEEPEQNEGRFLASGLGPCGFLRPSQRRRLDRLGLRQRTGRHGHGPRHVLRPVVCHCKKMKPEFDRASKDLLANDPPVTLAKIDCT